MKYGNVYDFSSHFSGKAKKDENAPYGKTSTMQPDQKKWCLKEFLQLLRDESIHKLDLLTMSYGMSWYVYSIIIPHDSKEKHVNILLLKIYSVKIIAKEVTMIWFGKQHLYICKPPKLGPFHLNTDATNISINTF